MRLVRAYNMELTSKECLFLIATIANAARGECVVETAAGEYPLDIYQQFRHEIEMLWMYLGNKLKLFSMDKLQLFTMDKWKCYFGKLLDLDISSV